MYVRLRFTETRVYADDHPGASARAGFFFDLVLSIFVFFPLFYTKIVHCRTSCIPARGDKKMSAHVPHIMRVILLYSRTLHVYIRLSRVLCLIYMHRTCNPFCTYEVNASDIFSLFYTVVQQTNFFVIAIVSSVLLLCHIVKQQYSHA